MHWELWPQPCHVPEETDSNISLDYIGGFVFNSVEKSCGVVLYNSRRVLVLQHKSEDGKGHWDFPKGHIEGGESELQTALRELEEETGISEISVVDGFRSEINYKIYKSGKGITKEVVFFLGITKIVDVVLSDEHVDFAWLNYNEALSRLTYDNARAILVQAQKHIPSVEV